MSYLPVGQTATTTPFTSTASSRFGMQMLPGLTRQQLGKLGIEMGAYLGTALASTALGVNLQPGVMLGGIPLYEVKRFEVGKSDKQMRFRSVGGQFMAFQEGDNIAIRIDLTLSGPLRFAWLTLLDMLYLRGLGTQKIRELQDRTPLGGIQGTVGSSWDASTAAQGAIPVNLGNFSMVQTPGTFAQSNFTASPIQVGRSTWNRVPANAPQDMNQPQLISEEPYEEIPHYQHRERIMVHKTFSIITEEEVFVNMFIETMMWSKSVTENGRNDINVYLMIRRFVEPPERFIIKSIEQKWYKTKSTTPITVSKLDYDQQRQMFLTADQQKIANAQQYIQDNIFLQHPQAGQKQIPRQAWAQYGGRQRTPYGNLRTPWTAANSGQLEEAYYRQEAEASRQEFLRSLSREYEDAWDHEDVPHTYAGVAVNNQKPGDFKLLAVNILWRAGWITMGIVSPLVQCNSLRLSSDPLMARLSSIVNMVDRQINGQVTKSNGNIQQFVNDGPAAVDSAETEQIFVKNVFNNIGIESEGATEISDILICPGRQQYLDKTIINGFLAYKCNGVFKISKGQLEFTSPLPFSMKVDQARSPYSAGWISKASINGYTFDAQPGQTYFIGTTEPPTWTKNERGYMVVNKPVLNESYLYVNTISVTEDKVTFIGYIFHPAYGITG